MTGRFRNVLTSLQNTLFCQIEASGSKLLYPGSVFKSPPLQNSSGLLLTSRQLQVIMLKADHCSACQAGVVKRTRGLCFGGDI
jgi:hypothetical protein